MLMKKVLRSFGCFSSFACRSSSSYHHHHDHHHRRCCCCCSCSNNQHLEYTPLPILLLRLPPLRHRLRLRFRPGQLLLLLFSFSSSLSLSASPPPSFCPFCPFCPSSLYPFCPSSRFPSFPSPSPPCHHHRHHHRELQSEEKNGPSFSSSPLPSSLSAAGSPRPAIFSACDACGAVFACAGAARCYVGVGRFHPLQTRRTTTTTMMRMMKMRKEVRRTTRGVTGAGGAAIGGLRWVEPMLCRRRSECERLFGWEKGG